MKPVTLNVIIPYLEAVIHGDVDAQVHRNLTGGGSTYMPLDPDEFLRQLGEAFALWCQGNTSIYPPKFIDVGCGIGTKVLLAREAGFDAYGIEMSPAYVEIARNLMERSPRHGAGGGYRREVPGHLSKIILGDAVVADYSPYDVIYFFNPSWDREHQLEQRILDTAKPGAIILANNPQLGVWRTVNSPLVRKVTHNVYIRRAS